MWKAMTDDELRVKAAEILGWTNIRLVGLKEIPHGTPPGRDEQTVWVIPCYPKYIAMAWELVEKLQEMERYPEVQNVGIHGSLWNVWLGPPPSNCGDSDLIAQDESPARAITQAFIIAMELTNAN